MEVSQLWHDLYSREFFQRRELFTFSWCHIGNVIGVRHGVWPQAYEHYFLPLVHCVEHRCPGLFLEIPHAMLCNAILEVGVDSAV